MKNLHKELANLLGALVETEYMCEKLDDCSNCICKNHGPLCEQFPLLIDIIQEVLHKES